MIPWLQLYCIFDTASRWYPGSSFTKPSSFFEANLFRCTFALSFFNGAPSVTFALSNVEIRIDQTLLHRAPLSHGAEFWKSLENIVKNAPAGMECCVKRGIRPHLRLTKTHLAAKKDSPQNKSETYFLDNTKCNGKGKAIRNRKCMDACCIIDTFTSVSWMQLAKCIKKL